MTEQIALLDPADCRSTDEGDPALRPDIDFLMESLQADGQKVPCLVAADVERPGKYVCIDGHGRIYCLGRLKCMVRAIVLPAMPNDVERIEVKFATNALRRSMTLEEIGIEATRYMELTDASQRETAMKLRVSDATISKALACLRRLPADIRGEVNRLGPSFTQLIASLPTEEAMRKALEYAQTPGADGRKPTRDQLMRLVAELRAKKKTKPKRRRLKLRVDDRRFEIDLKPGDSPEILIKAFQAAVARLTRHRELPLEAVAAALADKEPAAV